MTGVILGGEEMPAIQYVDATAANSVRVDGLPFAPTTGTNQGAVDDNWHVRTGFGNESTVFTADEAGGENAPMLKTVLTGVEPGLHDVFAYFWCDSGGDWRLQAGLANNALKIYRVRGTQHAQEGEFASAVEIDDAGRGLYRAYLGRVEVTSGGNLEVFIDDHSGSDGSRIWYDGIGYAPVPAFEQWQIANFGNSTVAEAARSADPDGDGQNNESESQWGTDPLSTSSYLGASVANPEGHIAVTWTSAPGVDYVIEYSSNLNTDWQVLTTKTGDPAPAQTTTYEDFVPPNVPRRFYRVRLAP